LNRTAVLHDARTFTMPAVLVIGGSLATLAVVGTGPYRTGAARPASTITVTAPAPAATPNPGRTTVVHRPAPRTSGPSPAPEVESVSDRTAALPHTSGGGMSHEQARPPSAPSPPPAACDGGALTVQALHALCVSLGR
jgi:hypothetical protein